MPCDETASAGALAAGHRIPIPHGTNSPAPAGAVHCEANWYGAPRQVLHFELQSGVIARVPHFSPEEEANEDSDCL